MSKKIGKIKKPKLLVNVDTEEFWVSGKTFKNPSNEEATLANTDTGEIRDRYGNREYMVGKRGVHRMSVRTKNSGKKLCFSGSPFACKFGQNIYTSPNILRGCLIGIKRAMKLYEIDPTQELLETWLAGDINLTRTDLAVNIRMRSEAEVFDTLDQIRWHLIGKYGTTRSSGTSVCWAPKEGKEYSIGFYAKAAQLRRSKQYRNHPERDRLIAEAETILRVELRLRAGELRKLKLEKASAWCSDTAEKVFRKYMARMKFLSVTSGTIADEELAKFPNNLRHVLALHKAGVNLKRIYQPRTLQRHYKAFRDRGIDLRCPNQQGPTITALPKFLSPRKVINTPPKWMVDANLVPTDKVAAVGKLKVQGCESSKAKSRVPASNDATGAAKPRTKAGK